MPRKGLDYDVIVIGSRDASHGKGLSSRCDGAGKALSAEDLKPIAPGGASAAFRIDPRKKEGIRLNPY